MKYANWSLVYANDPNNETLDKAAEQIIDLTGSANDEDSCIFNVKEEKYLVFISVEAVTKQIQVFHHLTQIDGSIAVPNTMMVAIMGFASDSPAIHVEDGIFSHEDDVKLPDWGTFKALSTAKEVRDIRPPQNGTTEKFRCASPIPPLLIPSFSSPFSTDPTDLFVDYMVAIKAFDTTHKDDASFPSALEACKHVLYFLWAASQTQITECNYVSQNSGAPKQLHDDLASMHLLPSMATAPKPGTLLGPSNATLVNLSGSISKLTDRLEKDSTNKVKDKAEKKDKFGKLPELSQSTILLASSKSPSVARTISNPELESLLQQSSSSRARTFLNQTIASFNCRIGVISILTALILAGDLVWTHSSHTPEKFTIFLMDKPGKTNKMSQKDWLKMHLQESNNSRSRR